MVIKTTEPVLMVMRPYQIYAVKAAKKRVLEVNQNGYVFACTGSGKTLTSFKLAQILRDEPMVDLVVFLIDRKDLDDQTIDEYNSFVLLKQMMIFVMIIYINTYRHNIIIYDLFHLVTAQEVD